MHLKSLTLRNFRNFRSSKFRFVGNAVNTIIGENASGKSNVFHAIRLVLDESLPSNARYLTGDDFNRSIGNPRGHWIVLSLSFGGLGTSDEELALVKHSAQAADVADVEAEGVYTFVYRPKYRVRKELSDITNDFSPGEERLKKVGAVLDGLTFTKEDYEVVAFTRTGVDFSDDAVYRQQAGDFANGIFPDPDLEDAAKIGNIKPAYFSLIKEVTCTFVKALRNVVADLRYAKSNPLLMLLARSGGKIAEADEILETVRRLNLQISDLAEVKKLSAGIRDTLLAAVGQTYAPSLDISSNLPQDMDRLIQSLGLIVEDSLGDTGTGSIDDLSLGGANLIYIALKLFEYESNQRQAGKIAHFLLIEEPEAHIHTHIQKTLFSGFASSNTQLFVSTHSTQISSVANISAINMIAKKRGLSDVYWPDYQLDPKDVGRIERYLDAVRSTLLFAKGVLICEGDAEQILIPHLVRKVLGVSLDEMGVSLLNINGTVFNHVSALFHPLRIRNYCAVLTDGDSAFLRAPTSYANQAYIDHLLASEFAGQQRKQKLDTHCAGNDFLSAHYSVHTFEVDLLLAGNAPLFSFAVSKIYTQPAAIGAARSDLASFDRGQRCVRALQLAHKEGKGWFALLLSEGVAPSTRIPKYILAALKSVLRGHEQDGIFRKMIDYRLKQIGSSLLAIENDVGSDLKSIVATIEDIIPDDDVLSLLQ